MTETTNTSVATLESRREALRQTKTPEDRKIVINVDLATPKEHLNSKQTCRERVFL